MAISGGFDPDRVPAESVTGDVNGETIAGADVEEAGLTVACRHASEVTKDRFETCAGLDIGLDLAAIVGMVVIVQIGRWIELQAAGK